MDDFGVKYQHRADLDFLVTCLSNLYHCKVHPIAHKFLGFTIEHDRTSRTLISLSYPGCIDALLIRLRLNGVKGYTTPSIYTPPLYGSSAPQSPLLTPPLQPRPPRKKGLQIAIGYLMYYGGCVDSHLLTATCALACELAHATLDTLTRLDRLLGYASAHRNGHRLYHAPRDFFGRLVSIPASRALGRWFLPPPHPRSRYRIHPRPSGVFHRPYLLPFHSDSCRLLCSTGIRVRRFVCRRQNRSATSNVAFSATSAILSPQRSSYVIMSAPLAWHNAPWFRNCRKVSTCAFIGSRIG